MRLWCSARAHGEDVSERLDSPGVFSVERHVRGNGLPLLPDPVQAPGLTM